MEIIEIVNVLNKVELFDELTEKDKDILARVALKKTYLKDQMIFSYEHKGQFFYVVESGEFQLRLKDSRWEHYVAGGLFGELAIFADNFHSGAIRVLTDGNLLAFSNKDVFNKNTVPESLTLKLSKLLARKITTYLKSYNLPDSKTLIKKGKNSTTEFRQFLRIKTDHVSVVKSLCAFMNNKGGTIFVGVDSSGNIRGITFSNDEEINFSMKVLKTHLREKVGLYHANLVSHDVEEIAKKKVLCIRCIPAERPAFYRQSAKEEHFFLRTGTSNSNLPLSEYSSYASKRFRSRGERTW